MFEYFCMRFEEAIEIAEQIGSLTTVIELAPFQVLQFHNSDDEILFKLRWSGIAQVEPGFTFVTITPELKAWLLEFTRCHDIQDCLCVWFDDDGTKAQFARAVARAAEVAGS
jgi:hypothetical protein